MKLSSKHLHSIQELRKEKERLKASVKDVSLIPDSPFTSSADAPAREEVADEANTPIDRITDLLSALPLKEMLGTFGGPILSLVGTQVKKKVVMRLATELIGGYVKWKAVELGYKAVKSYAKARKEKKRAQNTEKAMSK